MRRKRSPTSVALELAAVLLIAALAFAWGRQAAFAERGYEAIGGEYLILLLPAIYYTGKRTVLDWAREFGKSRRDTPRDKNNRPSLLARMRGVCGMTKRLTWTTPDGSWGVHGVELQTVPAKIYGALYKLMELESLVERLNDPDAGEFETEALMERLRAMAAWEPDPNGVEFFDGRRWRAC